MSRKALGRGYSIPKKADGIFVPPKFMPMRNDYQTSSCLLAQILRWINES